MAASKKTYFDINRRACLIRTKQSNMGNEMEIIYLYNKKVQVLHGRNAMELMDGIPNDVMRKSAMENVPPFAMANDLAAHLKDTYGVTLERVDNAECCGTGCCG